MYLMRTGAGKQYASAAVSTRNGKKTSVSYTYLGKIIDWDHRVFESKERGYFCFDPKTGQYSDVPEDFEFPETMTEAVTQKVSVDFGDCFFLDSFLWKSGLMSVLDAIQYSNRDTLLTLIAFYMFSTLANCDCEVWYRGSIAKLLYPKANVSSQRISDCLAAIGTAENRIRFLQAYSSFVLDNYCPDKNILIDSSGLPNSIHMEQTRTNVHNSVVSRETRLIYVVQRSTGLPLYFQSVPGNIVDKSTLESVFAHLKGLNINIDSCIFDCGYNDNDNLDLFYNEDHVCTVGFLTRCSMMDKRFKTMIQENIDTIEDRNNFVKYQDRYLFIVRKEIQVGTMRDNPAYLYLGRDISREGDETRSLIKRARKKSMSMDDVYDAIQEEGFFGIISSKAYPVDEILPAYYQRQQIEQTFDFAKNYTKLLPLRVDTEKTYRGHLLLSFIASVLTKMMQLGLKTADILLGSRLTAMRNQKCTIYKNIVVPDAAQADANFMYSTFGIKCPKSLDIVDYALQYHRPEPDKSSVMRVIKGDEAPLPGEKRGRGRPKGSKNKKKTVKNVSVEENDQPSVKRGRGRPKGSKNKKTLEREAAAAAARTSVNPADTEPPKRGRGRPKGSKNKKTLAKEALINQSTQQ